MTVVAVRCDSEACGAVYDDLEAFQLNGGVIIGHSSFFGTRDEKHACSPACAEKVVEQLARDLIAYGVRDVAAALS